MRILYDARGGGLGHITRGQAIGRQLIRRGHQFTLLARHNLWAVKDCGWTNRPAMAAIDEILPHLIITDTFPFGYAGEFTAWDGPMAFVWRERKDDDVAVRPHLSRFVAVIRPYPRGDGYILARDPDELPAPRRLNRKAPRIIAYHAGAECDQLFRAAKLAVEKIPGASLVCVGTRGQRRDKRHWPVMEMLPEFDLAITAGGYNSWIECRALGLRHVVWTLPRRYDDQEKRTGVKAWVLTAAELQRRIERALAKPRPRRLPAEQCRGAANAARKIVEAMGG